MDASLRWHDGSKMANSLTLTLAQLNPIVGALSYNLEKIRKIRDTVPEETDLILYPEMILTGYPPEDLVLKPFFMEKVEEAVETLVKESAVADCAHPVAAKREPL